VNENFNLLSETQLRRRCGRLRVRTRLMHYGVSLTPRDAIPRHDGEARFVINNFRGLSDRGKTSC